MAAKQKADSPKKAASKRVASQDSSRSAARKRSARRPRPVPSITDDQRRSLLRPGAGFETATARLVETWRTTGKRLKVTGHTAAELNSLLKKALKAADRERDVIRAHEARLRPLTDARMLAMHELWRAVLDVYATVRGVSAPEVQEQFEFLSGMFARSKRRRGDNAPDPTEG